MLITGLLFLLILGLLVFVHELGHFWAAKKNGVTVHEFAFGFRPRLVSWKRGETEYAINLLPLGGYVRLEGEGSDTGKKGSFAGKSTKVKALVLVAGVVMNVIFAWIALIFAYVIGATPLTPSFSSQPYAYNEANILVQSVTADSPASSAGLQTADQLIALDGQTFSSAQDFITKTKERVGEPITLTVERGGDTKELTLTPRKDPPAGQGPIGVGLLEASLTKAKWYQAPVTAAYEVISEMKQTLVGLGTFVRDLVVKQEASENVSGIIGVGVATGIVRKLGIGSVLQFIAIISANLALINILPIPPLDGGHLAFVLLERFVKRPLEAVKGYVTMAGLAIILLFAVFVSYQDILRFGLVERIKQLF